MSDDHEIDRDRRRASPFDALNDSDARMQTSASVEARLRGEVRSLGRTRRQASISMMAIAATLVALIGAAMWFAREARRHEPSGTQAVADAGAAPGDGLTGFVPLGYNQIPAENTHIIRLEVPRHALASFGLLPLDAADAPASEKVLADVIIGDDGLARAVRFVGPAPDQE